ncbi:MAG TPA: tetraacyldisaccharide 4'-kinase [Candidatus Omnitrophota bacterium]|nr:tetraacyldisaccharide 4'-kinase [Candidatus Omnitrophota bacterium]HPT38682.1 tetraacyldisaccharide 4'-kinase [Candidatus Omnitrophota bacterium]
MFLSREYLYDLVTGKISGPGAMFLRGCLFILSLVYGLAVVILSGFYRIKPARLGSKVISVGNITLGGTGKTTLVEYICAKLISAGHKVAVLSRGYKRVSGKQGACRLGDEPAMLQKKLPQVAVVVDKNRIKAAKSAMRDHGSDTLVLDDGLQQWKIHKDLEIVTINAGDPFGNGYLLPAGFLREPLWALKRADILVLTQISRGHNLEGLEARLKRINPRALIVESRHEPVGVSRLDQADELLDPGFLRNKPVAIFSGIGNSEGFGNCVEELGIKVGKFFKFADHYDYTQSDILWIMKEAKENNLEAIITTHKDAVKIRELGVLNTGILVLEIKLNIIKNEAEFNRRLLKLYSL